MSVASDIYLCDDCEHHAVAREWPRYGDVHKERNCILCGAEPAPHAFFVTRTDVKELITELRPTPPAQ